MADPGGTQLIPGTPITPTFPLARYRSHHLSGVVRAIAESSTKPGDLILAIGVVAGAPIAEAVASGRRIIALDRNPIHLLWAHLDLAQVPLDRVQTALTKLGDLPKDGRPLISYINDLYTTRCPHCGTRGVAEWFAWDREAGRPYAKRVRCRRCETTYDGPVDQEDLAAAGGFPVRAGPAYHLALSRVVPADDPAHERVAELVQLYTQRNLTALMDVTNRLPQLHLPQDTYRAVTALVLEAMDRGSSLLSASAPDERPRSLRPPQRFLETNVWMVLEQAMGAYKETATTSRSLIDIGGATQAVMPSLSALLGTSNGAYLLLDSSIQDLDRSQINRSVAAVVFEVRPPEATTWALSMLWASWLSRDSLARGLHGFLSRRRLDWDWYSRSLAAALRQLTPLVRPAAPILMIAPDDGPSSVKAILHAAAHANLRIDRWIACPPLGYRIVLRDAGEWSPSGRQPRLAASYPRTAQGTREIEESVLRRRGEPTERWEVSAMNLLESEDPDLPELDGDDDPALMPLSDHYVWLRAAHKAEAPLGDRVEELILALLTGEQHWRPESLVAAVYAMFEGVLSPEPELVTACIDAYTAVDADGRLSLRPEDEPDRRRAEAQQMKEEVQALGERLGYSVGRRLGGDIVWKEGQSRPFLFRCTTTAVLGPHLLKSPPPCDGTRCLIIPGGRAALTALKLRRDPRLSELAEANRWAFVKFRHLRRMAEEIHTRSDIEVILGLDPFVERESAQLKLPFEIASHR